MKTFAITDAWYREIIQKHFSNVNPDAIPVTLRRLVYRKIEMILKEEKVRRYLTEIERRGITPGDFCYVRGETVPSIVAKVTIDGHIIVKGRSGSFNPGSVKTQKEKEEEG